MPLWLGRRYHSQFLVNRSRYASLFELKAGDYKGWAHGLKKAGYATDPGYAQKLLLLINKYELHQYDTEVLGYAYKEEKSLSPIPNTPPLPIGTKKEIAKTAPAKTNSTPAKNSTAVVPTGEKSIAKRENTQKKDTTALTQKVDSTQVTQKEKAIVRKDSTEVNNTSVSKPNTQAKPEEVAMELIKMYIVKKGDTLYNISRRSGVSVEQLMSLNNMNNSNINLGQVLVIRE